MQVEQYSESFDAIKRVGRRRERDVERTGSHAAHGLLRVAEVRWSD